MEPIRHNRGVTFRHLPLKSNQGFTLIELLVVIAIIITITGVMITNQSSFNKTLVLANTAYDIALTLRSAAVYGISSRSVGGVTNAGYGLHFERGTTGSFILFSDTSSTSDFSCHGVPLGGSSAPDAKPGNCMYDPGEKVLDYNLGNNMTVSNFCAWGSGAWRCAATGELTSLDILFARPDPTPFIRVNGNGSIGWTKACLTISSSEGTSRYISVVASGAILVNALSCS